MPLFQCCVEIYEPNEIPGNCLTQTPLQPDQDLQSPETAPIVDEDPEWMEPLSPPEAVLHEDDQDVDSTNKRTHADLVSKRKPRAPPRFKRAWLKMFWFLRYSQTLDQMWCHVCRLYLDKSDQNNGLIKGSRLFRYQSIKQHSASNCHSDSMSRHMLHMCNLQLFKDLLQTQDS